MANQIENLAHAWSTMSPVRRIVLVTMVLAAIGAAIFLGKWASKPKMVLLFSGLEPTEASKIVEKIRDEKTPFELSNGGSTIYVPESKVYALRLTLAGDGLVGQGQDGYSILDRESIGSSPFRQRIDYIRAIEGELARTVKSMQGVQACRVHITQPEKALFNRNQNKSTASIVVRLKGGRTFTNSQVSAIINLVAAGAGGGLTSDNVVLVDGSSGNIVSTGSKDQQGRVVDGVDRYVSSIEESLSRKAEEMLELVVGRGNVRVRVTTEVSRTSLEETIEQNTDGVVISETIQNDSSVPVGGKNAASGNKTTKETIETTRLPDRKITKRVELPGQVLRKSVAVIVDLSGRQTSDSTSETSSTKTQQLTIADVSDLVKTCLDITDKDQLSVKEASLIGNIDTTLDIEPAGMFSIDNIMQMIRQASLGILVIGVLLGLKIFYAPKVKGNLAASRLLSGSDAELQAALESGKVEDLEKLLPGGAEGAFDAQALKSRISAALQENPEEVKRLFLSWSENDRGEV